jgi:hypothetical protein
MADFTNYGALTTLEAVLAQTPAPFPASLYVKLHIGDPGADALLNPAANDVRVVIDFAPAANVNTDGRAQAASLAAVGWASVPNTETYSHISIWDDLVAGNAWYKDAMVAPVPVTAGGAFVFPVGQTIDHV